VAEQAEKGGDEGAREMRAKKMKEEDGERRRRRRLLALLKLWCRRMLARQLSLCHGDLPKP
jgi:hypothetical protein